MISSGIHDSLCSLKPVLLCEVRDESLDPNMMKYFAFGGTFNSPGKKAIGSSPKIEYMSETRKRLLFMMHSR